MLVPVHGRSHSQQQSGRLHILRVFEFNSEILMSGSLVTAGSPHATTGLLFVKGAHTAVEKLLPRSSLPADFDQVTKGGIGPVFFVHAVWWASSALSLSLQTILYTLYCLTA